MLRVLHINDYREAGGAEVLVDLLVTLERDYSIDATLFTSEDVPHHRRTPWTYLSNRRACIALREKLASFSPRVVHLHNWYHELSPAILSELARYKRTKPLRVVMTAHDHHLLSPDAGMRWFQGVHGERWQIADSIRLRSLGYLLSRRWDARSLPHSCLKLTQYLWHYRVLRRLGVIEQVIAPSRYLGDLLSSRGFPVVIVPHPAPPPSVRSEGRPSTLQLVYAGRVEPEKGVAWFLAHLPDDRDFALTIVGDGSDLPRCKAACTRRGFDDGRVVFAGRLTHAATLEAVARAHILVLPSLVPEAAGLALLEALAVGTNILTTELGGQAELVADARVGYTFIPESPEALRGAIKRIRDDHASGTLNSFDARSFLLDRGERRFVDRVFAAYGYAT